jgi:hypothetical protein
MWINEIQHTTCTLFFRQNCSLRLVCTNKKEDAQKEEKDHINSVLQAEGLA